MSKLLNIVHRAAGRPVEAAPPPPRPARAAAVLDEDDGFGTLDARLAAHGRQPVPASEPAGGRAANDSASPTDRDLGNPDSRDEHVEAAVQPAAAAAAPTIGSAPLAGEANRVSNEEPLHAINVNTYVSHIGDGVTQMFRTARNAETGQHHETPITVEEINLEHAHEPRLRVYSAGRETFAGHGTAWAKWPKRRAYPAGIGMWPEGDCPAGAYNLYRGLGVVPAPGDPTPILRHINHVLCSGKDDSAGWLVHWLAYKAQHPGRRPETAVVIRGGRGCGKGTLARLVLRIFGPHGMHITSMRHLVGHFNGHLRYTLFLAVDEGYWAGDKDGLGTLKGLITEPTLTIEAKHRDAISVPNRLSVMILSNESWVVPAGTDERRFFVVDASTEKAQDKRYFDELNRWIDNGGDAIFLHYLLNLDLAGFDPRYAPRTAALARQIVETLPALDRWLLDGLDTGVFLNGGEWGTEPAVLLCGAATLGFAEYAKRANVRARLPDAREIGRRLQEVFGVGPADKAQLPCGGRGRGWRLPGLAQARARAAQALGLGSYAWGSA